MRAAIAAALLAFAVPLVVAGARENARGAPAPGADFLPSTYRPLPRQDLIIAGATILDGVGGRHDQADIHLHDGKIVAIGRNLPRPDGVQVIEAAGRWVTPGLI